MIFLIEGNVFTFVEIFQALNAHYAKLSINYLPLHLKTQKFAFFQNIFGFAQ